MIVYQCNSCNATVGGNAAGQTLPNLPGSRLPMRFGLIEFNRD